MREFDLHTLPIGYKLQNYRILEVLGEGGFGITYLAYDEALDQKVAIKEYFPSALVRRDLDTKFVKPRSQDAAELFQKGLKDFSREAKLLARLSHPNIVRVLYFTNHNNTGYMVMQYEEGEPLHRWVKRFPGGRASQLAVKALLEPILEALETVHHIGITHRDIKPANIYIRANGTPVILDFGAARYTLVDGHPTAIASNGFSPIEQYSDGQKQGPWTDIYAVAAVAFYLISGKAPPNAPSRIAAKLALQPDPCPKLKSMRLPGFDVQFSEAIDKGLSCQIEERPESIDDWRRSLGFNSDFNRSHELEASNIAANRKRLHPQDGRPQASHGINWLVLLPLLAFCIGALTFISPTRQDLSPPGEFGSAPENEAPSSSSQNSDASMRSKKERVLEDLAHKVTPGSGQSFKDCPVCPELVVVPAGSFVMELPARIEKQKTVHQTVTISRPFAVGKYEVTWDELEACARDGGCSKEYLYPGRGAGRHPAVGIDFIDAGEYTAWLSKRTGKNYRLPSQSEWEYAARASSPLIRGPIVTENGTKPVDSKLYPPNAWGLHHATTNASEWTQDCWGWGEEDYPQVPPDGTARGGSTFDCLERVIRGGSWQEQDPFTAYQGYVPTGGYKAVGFRVVREMEK